MRSAFLAFSGLPRVRFLPSEIALAASGEETNFNLSFIPTSCLHVLRFVKYGHVQVDSTEASRKILIAQT